MTTIVKPQKYVAPNYHKYIPKKHSIHTHQFATVPRTRYPKNCSYGIIPFRISGAKKEKQYLMVRRAHSIAYVEFLRGKYSVTDADYVKKLVKHMTIDEINRIRTLSFEQLWRELWPNMKDDDPSLEIKKWTEEQWKTILTSTIDFPREKFYLLRIVSSSSLPSRNKTIPSIENIIENYLKSTEPKWEEPEWEFSKGKKNVSKFHPEHMHCGKLVETNHDCAIREFEEETGLLRTQLQHVQNAPTFHETFVGLNDMSFTNSYFIKYMNCDETMASVDGFHCEEISELCWCNLSKCLQLIRPYHKEKQETVIQVSNWIEKHFRG